MAIRTTMTPHPSVKRKLDWVRNLQRDWLIHLLLGMGLVVAFIPIFFMLSISLKNPGQMLTEPLGITPPFQWSNYLIAFNVLKRSMINTIGMTVVVVLLSLTVSSLAGYAFSRFRFPGRDLFFWMYLSVLFIPSILTFATQYTLVSQLGLLDTYTVQILPYVAHAQIFMAVVFRAFFGGISNEIVEAAVVDGARAMQVYWYIILPMSRPIIATLAVMRALSFWDEWLWPMVTITRYELRPVGLQVFYLASDVGDHVGRQMAGNALAIVPMLLLFIFASKQFVEGLTSGALKW